MKAPQYLFIAFGLPFIVVGFFARLIWASLEVGGYVASCLIEKVADF